MRPYCILFALFATGLVNARDNGLIKAEEFNQIVVLPDVHGDSLALLRSLWLGLKKTEIAPPDFRYFTEEFHRVIVLDRRPRQTFARRTDVVLVQLGDLVDRGPDSSYCISIMEAVERIIGWRTVRLFGNHELMALTDTGDEYIHDEDARGFGGLLARSRSFHFGGHYYDQLTDNFLAFAKLSKRGARNETGSPNTLFVHGGVDLEWIRNRLMPDDDRDIHSLNDKFEYVLRGPRDEVLDRFGGGGSVLWTRTLADAPEEQICGEHIDNVLEHFGVARVILGHTPQDDKLVKPRCGGKIILADVRMSRWMDDDEEGNPTAIIISLDPQSNELKSIIAHHTDMHMGMWDREGIIFRAETPDSEIAQTTLENDKLAGVKRPRE